MKTFLTLFSRPLLALACLAVLAPAAHAQDWPQWRGANRDGKVSGFSAPAQWPAELTQKWKVTVGKGDASPALVGDKVFVFSRDGGDELVQCLDLLTGREVWSDKYAEQAATEPMGRHPGPRSSPAVARGKVLAFGARGTLSCLDEASGKMLWRKADEKSWPKFFTSSSPLAVENLCVVQLGGEEKGGVFAYELSTGAEKWKWTEDGTAYSSPVTARIAGESTVVAMTAKKIIGLRVADGKLLWEVPFAVQGRAYNAATPIVDGDTVIFAGSGRGTKAVKIEKSGDGFASKELWSNPDNAVQFNTPVLGKGRLYGLSQKGEVFCLDSQTGKTLWTGAFGGKDFGSVVDLGSALVALASPGELAVFEPGDKEFKKVAGYKVASTDVYAHPVVSNKGFLIKDQESLALWSLQ